MNTLTSVLIVGRMVHRHTREEDQGFSDRKRAERKKNGMRSKSQWTWSSNRHTDKANGPEVTIVTEMLTELPFQTFRGFVGVRVSGLMEESEAGNV